MVGKLSRVLKPWVSNHAEFGVQGKINHKHTKFEASVAFSEDILLPPGGGLRTQGAAQFRCDQTRQSVTSAPCAVFTIGVM